MIESVGQTIELAGQKTGPVERTAELVEQTIVSAARTKATAARKTELAARTTELAGRTTEPREAPNGPTAWGPHCDFPIARQNRGTKKPCTATRQRYSSEMSRVYPC